MVAVGVGSLILGFVASFYVVSARSFASFGCYTDLNKQDRYTSDVLTRDIRSASQVVSYSSTQLNLIAGDGSYLRYTYYSGSNTLVRTNGGISRILLRDITPGTFSFSVYQRPTNASPTFESFPAATNAANVKLIGFQWSCSTTVPATTMPQSESLKSGLVSIRNQ
ncbi:MAG: hypothetical protein C5B50_00560 [Verrucomicrobia bacterium]|nr:MAG: hypothetical protein C5B50_00560 [Verrucomicrobiota bacterium]